MPRNGHQTDPIQENDISEAFRSLIEIVWYFGPRTLDGACCENLSMPEFIALEKISHTQNCPVQDVGVKLGFTKSGATRIVNRLEKKGLVKKHKFPNDARVCCIVTTSKGKQTLDSAEKIVIFKLEHLLSKMPVESRQNIKDALIALAGTVSE